MPLRSQCRRRGDQLAFPAWCDRGPGHYHHPAEYVLPFSTSSVPASLTLAVHRRLPRSILRPPSVEGLPLLLPIRHGRLHPRRTARRRPLRQPASGRGDLVVGRRAQGGDVGRGEVGEVGVGLEYFFQFSLLFSLVPIDLSRSLDSRSTTQSLHPRAR